MQISQRGCSSPDAFDSRLPVSLSRAAIFRRSLRAEDCTPSQTYSRRVADLRASYTANRGAMMPRCAPDTKELPEEPESGSSSSSTTEPVEVTNTHNSKAFIGTALKQCIDRFASRPDKAGFRPDIISHP